MGVGSDIETERAARRDETCRATIVELSLVGDVAESINVGMAIAVELHAEKVCCKAEFARANINIECSVHVVDGWVGVIWPGNGVDGNGHRYAAATAHERGSSTHFVRGDVVQRAFFIVWTPSPPILERLEEPVKLREGHF